MHELRGEGRLPARRLRRAPAPRRVGGGAGCVRRGGGGSRDLAAAGGSGVSADDTLLREADAAARALSQREFARPIALEAGAGTGKTATLVARVLAWALGPGWQRAEASLARAGTPVAARVAARVLDGIVAITFTEAA